AAASGCRLDWDSAFFGVPIGQGRAETAADVEAIDVWAQRENLRCIYLLVSGGRVEVTQTAEAKGVAFAGTRVTLWRDLSMETPRVGDHGPITVRSPRLADVDTLEQIAATSHRDTRFYVDRNFPRELCDRLYRVWIRRSCDGWANQVLVADIDGRPGGYLSLHLRSEREAIIGLVGVAADARRIGIGCALVDAAFRWCRERSVIRLNVATPAQNVAGLRLYQRMGFLVSDVDLWFHKWR